MHEFQPRRAELSVLAPTRGGDPLHGTAAPPRGSVAAPRERHLCPRALSTRRNRPRGDSAHDEHFDATRADVRFFPPVRRVDGTILKLSSPVPVLVSIPASVPVPVLGVPGPLPLPMPAASAAERHPPPARARPNAAACHVPPATPRRSPLAISDMSIAGPTPVSSGILLHWSTR